MSQSPVPNPYSTDDLQFTTAEPADSNVRPAETGRQCALCQQPIVSTYFALGDQLLCPACCEHVENVPAAGSKMGRLAKAAFMGLAAGLLGALIWFAIRRVAHIESGLVAILVGFMVGKAVHRGSGGRGGRGYQVLAVALTYCCIAANYMPDILESVFESARKRDAQAAAGPQAAAPAQADAKPVAELAQGNGDIADGVKPEPAEAAHPQIGIGGLIYAIVVLMAIVFALSLAAPFLAGAQNLIGLLIIGFALWEAWKFNAHRPLPLSGPHQLGSPPAA